MRFEKRLYRCVGILFLPGRKKPVWQNEIFFWQSCSAVAIDLNLAKTFRARRSTATVMLNNDYIPRLPLHGHGHGRG